MTDAAKEARREYRRKWYQQNRERVRDYNARYWERKAGSDTKTQLKAQETEVTRRRDPLMN